MPISRTVWIQIYTKRTRDKIEIANVMTRSLQVFRHGTSLLSPDLSVLVHMHSNQWSPEICYVLRLFG